MKKRTRSKNLSDDTISIIVQLLDGWASKLTWDHLISAIDFRINQHYTRQALSNHPQIKSAYDATKQRLSDSKVTENIASIDNQTSTIKALEIENNNLKEENKKLLDQVARWVYNAYAMGIKIDELDKPLKVVD